jgi:hypothetical protein
MDLMLWICLGIAGASALLAVVVLRSRPQTPAPAAVAAENETLPLG